MDARSISISCRGNWAADKGPPPLRQIGIKALVGPLKEEERNS